MDKDFISKFLKGSASTTLGTLSSVVFHFVSIVLMTRFTTKEVLGLYFLILAITNGGKILASLGLDLTLVHYFVSEEKPLQQQLFAAIVWTRIVVFVLIVSLSYFWGSYLLQLFSPGLIAYRWFVPLLIILMSVRELFFYVLQGLQRYRLYAIIQTVSAVLKVALIALISGMLSLSNLLIIEAVVLSLSIIAQLWVTRTMRLHTPSMLFDKAILPDIFRFGLPLYANSAFTYISNFGAVFIVGVFLSPISIAAYEVARKIPEGLTRLFTSFRVVYFPSLTSLFAKGDLRNAQKLMNTSLVLLAAGTFSIVLGGLLFSHEIVLLVFSEKYLSVQPAFVLLLLAVCLHLLATTMGYSMVAAGHPEQSTITNVVSMGLELVLSFLLIPQVGYIGAAYSYIIMTIIAQALGYFYLRRAGAVIKLRSYLMPFTILALVSGLYLAVGSDGWIWRILLLSAYLVLSALFISEVKQALVYLKDFVSKVQWRGRNSTRLSDQPTR